MSESMRGKSPDRRFLRAMVVDTWGRINTIRSMSFSRGSSLVTRADAALLDCGIIPGDAGISWLQE